MKQRIVFFMTFLCLLFSCNANIEIENARDSARKAYHLMEESPFDGMIRANALKLISKANQTDPNEPWVYIASSLATMQSGYKIGSWFHKDSFQERALDKALELANKAIQVGPDESQAYAHLARVLIIKGEYRKAWDHLNTAYQLDNSNFYAWFYKALVFYYKQGYDKALENLDEAEALITHRYQIKMVTRQKGNVARQTGDTALEEKMYKKNIEDFPQNAYMYGNYGSFLLRNNRPKEAVHIYEQAIAISPYPQARKMLEKAKKELGVDETSTKPKLKASPLER